MSAHESVLDLASRINESFDSVLTPAEREMLDERRRRDTPAEEIYSTVERAEALEEFEAHAAAAALVALADDIDTIVQARLAEAYRQGLEVYYAAAALARLPENAHLIPHVEAMRAAHLEQYGKAISEKE